MRIFFGGRDYGESKAVGGVVEGRREESAGVCEESVVVNADGQEIAAVARGGGAESDEIGDPVSIDPAEGGIGRLSVLFNKSGPERAPETVQRGLIHRALNDRTERTK